LDSNRSRSVPGERTVSAPGALSAVPIGGVGYFDERRQREMIRKVELIADDEDDFALSADAADVSFWVDLTKDADDLAGWLREDPQHRRLEVRGDDDASLGFASSIEELFTLFREWLAGLPMRKISVEGFAAPLDAWPERSLTVRLTELSP
jgi:hypothetical protein